jgi:hypothetical protein
MSDIGLSEAVQAVREELSRIKRRGEGEEIRFGVGPVEVEFEVAVAREATADGKVRVWVLELGAAGKVAKTVTHRVLVTLDPRSPDGPLEVGDRLRRPGR